jgi:hypothetical protein
MKRIVRLASICVAVSGIACGSDTTEPPTDGTAFSGAYQATAFQAYGGEMKALPTVYFYTNFGKTAYTSVTSGGVAFSSDGDSATIRLSLRDVASNGSMGTPYQSVDETKTASAGTHMLWLIKSRGTAQDTVASLENNGDGTLTLTPYLPLALGEFRLIRL